MTNDRLIRQAREAAIRRRAAGGPVLPLSEAFYLDPETAQLLDALMALGILEPADLQGLSADSVSTERTSTPVRMSAPSLRAASANDATTCTAST